MKIGIAEIQRECNVGLSTALKIEALNLSVIALNTRIAEAKELLQKWNDDYVVNSECDDCLWDAKKLTEKLLKESK